MKTLLTGILLLAAGLSLPLPVSGQALTDSTNVPVNLAVPDGNPNGLASTVTVSTPIQALTNLQVTLEITNGWNGDLHAYLVHDSGLVVVLNRPGKSAALPLGYSDFGFNGVTFDGGATTNVHTYRLTLFGNENTPLGGPLTSTWAPDGRNVDPATVSSTNAVDTFLSSFNELNPNGRWTLFIADLADGDVSTLVSWGLQMSGTAEVPALITITAQPTNTTAECGGTASFSVTATGTEPLHYQWYFDTATPVGIDSSNLVLNAVSAANDGGYTVAITNGSGSITSQVATLTVQDTAPPVITVLGADPLTNECHTAFVDPGATATDACATPSLTTNSTVNPDALGSYTINYVATDGSGHSATNTRTVYVVDTTAPVIMACAPPQTVTADYNGMATLSNLTTLVVATDTCSGSVHIAQQPPAGTAIPVGATNVVFYVDDGNGNTNTCSSTVTVNAAPLVPPTILSEQILGDGSFQLTFSAPDGQPYTVLASPDVAMPLTGWATLTNGHFGASPAIFTDTDATNYPARFYRAVSP